MFIFLPSILVFSILPFFRNYGVLPFISLIVLLPISNTFSKFFYFSGLFVYDFYFFSFVLLLSIKNKIRGRFILGVIFLTITYALITLVAKNDFSIYFLRDLRLALYAISLLCLLQLRELVFKISLLQLQYLAIAAAISSLIFTTLIYNDHIILDDTYYINNKFRYFSAGSYFCLGFILFTTIIERSKRKGMLFHFALCLSLISVAMTGFRVMMLISLSGLLIQYFRSLTFWAILSFFSLAVIQALQSDAIGNRALEIVGRFRHLKFSNLQELLMLRFDPFFSTIENFSTINYIFGGGLGTTFYVPWFEYRDNIDVLNNTVDNTFLVLYAKFGILSLLILLAYLFTFSLFLKQRYFVLIVFYLLPVLWLVYCIPYQITAIGLTTAAFAVGMVKQSMLVNERKWKNA